MQYKNKFFGIVAFKTDRPLNVIMGKLLWLDKAGVISSGPSITFVAFGRSLGFVLFTDFERG